MVILQNELAGMVPPVTLMLVEPAVFPVRARLQGLVKFVTVGPDTFIWLGVDGKLSVRVTPVAAALFGLVIVIVSVDLSPMMIDCGLNDLVKVGGPLTVRLTEAEALPVPPSVGVTPLLAFGKVPPTVPVTLKVTVHVPFPPGMVPPLKVTVLPLTVGGKVIPQELVADSGDAKLSLLPWALLFSVSETLTLVNDWVLGLGLVMVSVTVEVPFTEIEVGVNDLMTVAGNAVMIRVSDVGVVLLPALPEFTPLIVLRYVPRFVPVTLPVRVQVPPAAMLMLPTVRLELPTVLPV